MRRLYKLWLECVTDSSTVAWKVDVDHNKYIFSANEPTKF
jgi:hypothetical protein